MPFGGCWKTVWEMVGVTRVLKPAQVFIWAINTFCGRISQHHQVWKYERRAFELSKGSVANPKHHDWHAFYTALLPDESGCEGETRGKCVVMNLHTGFSHVEISTRSPPAITLHLIALVVHLWTSVWWNTALINVNPVFGKKKKVNA